MNRVKEGAAGGILCDSHMHTEFSTDSEAPVRSMLDAAVERGLDSVCITDHMDLDFPPQEGKRVLEKSRRFSSMWINISKCLSRSGKNTGIGWM